MNHSLNGGCQCGAVRYECNTEPLFMGNCHCRDCQRATGGAYAPAMGVPAETLKVRGEVKYYDIHLDSGGTSSRGFCPTCGARLFGKSSATPTIIALYAGSLDEPSVFQPAGDIFTSSAQPWDYMNPDLPKFTRQPKI